MDNFYARSVFFVRDGEDSLAFYTQTLGFKLDWNNQYQGRASVFQVSLFGFELILNQIYPDTEDRAGHGREWKDDLTNLRCRGACWGGRRHRRGKLGLPVECKDE